MRKALPDFENENFQILPKLDKVKEQKRKSAEKKKKCSVSYCTNECGQEQWKGKQTFGEAALVKK